MIADSERREAAERLRDEVGCGSSWPGLERLGLILGIKREPRTGWEGRILTRLADLIDPDCEEGRYSVARTARPVDRDALLARRAERTCRNLNPPSCRDFECSECGESSEFTPGFMPNYCPSCGARVTEVVRDAD